MLIQELVRPDGGRDESHHRSSSQCRAATRPRSRRGFLHKTVFGVQLLKVRSASTGESAIVAVKPAAIRPNPAEISLAWHASTDNVGVAGHRVERCHGANCSDFSQIGTSTSNSYMESGLPASAVYRYRVRAVDVAANAGPYSNTLETETASHQRNSGRISKD
jgi:hypothetical protein